jgi:hypothetical protein
MLGIASPGSAASRPTTTQSTPIEAIELRSMGWTRAPVMWHASQPCWCYWSSSIRPSDRPVTDPTTNRSVPVSTQQPSMGWISSPSDAVCTALMTELLIQSHQ